MMVGERTLSSSLPSDCQVRVFGEKSVGPDHFLSTCMVHEPASQPAIGIYCYEEGLAGVRRKVGTIVALDLTCFLHVIM